MKRIIPLKLTSMLALALLSGAFPGALSGAGIGAMPQNIRPFADTFSRPPDAPLPPEASLPAAVTPPAAPEAAAWEGYFRRLGETVRKGGLTDAGKNMLELLVDGREVMDAAGPDIAQARSFIHIKIFQWQADEIGASLRDVLEKKVKAGVRVRVILDSLGSSLMAPDGPEKRFVKSMKSAGIEVKVRKFQLLHLDHRKVIVMDNGYDGLVAYTGGMNIGNDYQRNWHDQQTRINGPAAELLNRAFLDGWKKVTGEELSGFPAAKAVEEGAQTYVITHTGGDTDRNIKKAYLLAINTARQLIRIEDPYFTDKDIIKALINAASDPRRPGLKIQLVVPAINDMPVTLRAFRSHYPDMLKAGIEVYEYQPRMEHLKVAVMDHIWSTVGSSNLDPQSLKYNDELNLLVFDKEFAAEIDSRIFDNDIAQSLRITAYKPNAGDDISGHLPFLTPQLNLPPDLLNGSVE
ncbi:MAG: phospholipase D-like domain-containing protein [Elusimicrobiales bacterium]|nr:phospholipase D-like domain-containing protein [Elusimicrobiales bacterium]